MASYNTGKYVCTLSPELLERAKVELNEDPARREEDIEILRKWILASPHINGRTDDVFLLKFLRNAKFSIERAKEKLDNYYTMRTAIPEWFANVDFKDPKVQKVLKLGVFVPLGYDKQGRKVVIGRMGTTDPSEIKVDDVMKTNVLLGEWLQMDEQTQICGTVFINDMTGTSGGHMAQWTPTVAKKAMTSFQDCMPIRMKGMHYWKPPSFFEAAFQLFKVFMKDKFLRRVVVHGSKLESLHAAFPIEILPTEYGGTAGDMSTIIDKMMKDLGEFRDFFLDDCKYKVDESKRPGKPKTQEELFGVDGTFRKLNID